MEVAQNASLFGDIVILLFAAVLFLLSGVAIGFLTSRRRYLGPLTKLESDLRRIRNEQIRDRTFGERKETTQHSNIQQEEEPVFDTIAEWTQKIFDIIEPAAIIETDNIGTPSGDSDSIPVDELSVDLSATHPEPVVEAPVVQRPVVEAPVVQKPVEPVRVVHNPVVPNTLVAQHVSSAHQNIRPRKLETISPVADPFPGSPATAFSLTQEQAAQLSNIKMNSFALIARLSPAGIIRLATVINVPIREIEDVWIPEAEYRLHNESTGSESITSDVLQTEGMEVSS